MPEKFGLSAAAIDAINSVFSNHPKVEEVILYGSRAKGNFRTGSDIDLTIIETEIDFSELLKIEQELDDLMLPYSIDLSQKRKIESIELLEHIERVGMVFYKKDNAHKNS